MLPKLPPDYSKLPPDYMRITGDYMRDSSLPPTSVPVSQTYSMAPLSLPAHKRSGTHSSGQCNILYLLTNKKPHPGKGNVLPVGYIGSAVLFSPNEKKLSPRRFWGRSPMEQQILA